MGKTKGKKKEKYGKSKHYHYRRTMQRRQRTLKSWKRDYPDYFDFDPDRYPYYFPKARK